jgi:hypothetical protein
MSDEKKKPTDAGEFTRVFGGGKEPVSPNQETVIIPTPVQKSEPPPARPPQPQRPPQRPPDKAFGDRKDGPGEFTQLFRTPGAPMAAPPAVQRPAPPQESEFTRFFKGDQLPRGREVDWKEVEQAPEPAAETKAAGEFTHLFGRVAQPQAAPAQTPAAPPRERFAPSVIQVDEFAKIIAPRPASSQPQAAASAADDLEPAANRKGPALTILLVVIAAILILAGCAIYFFVVRT